MIDKHRLIERAFPLKQTSLDSVHEKMCHAGHIKAIHIWPARRPLAACRAALIATLLPDPGTPEERLKLCEKIGGKVVRNIEKKRMPNGMVVERIKEETEGGILHWKSETENAETVEWFRKEIRNAYGGRAPRVLDPFAGGGAIPLEAMRLGCEVTAVDINPVAWFILKCTLEYPQKLAGKTHPLPGFIMEDEGFMNAFYKAHPHLVGRTKRTKKQAEEFEGDLFLKDKPDSGRVPKADIAWHIRAWGKWVLDRARFAVAKFYPTYADFEPLKPGKAYEKQPMKFVPLKDDGSPDIDALNLVFSADYLSDKSNPRWIAKSTAAYLWARTVTCKNCRATVPFLKTRWLLKKGRKRVLLTMEPDTVKRSVVFGIQYDVPEKGGNAAQRREHDKRIGAGTMSRAGAKCPCCLSIMTMEDLHVEGKAGNLGVTPTVIVVNGRKGKEYRLPTEYEIMMAEEAGQALDCIFKNVPFGVPNEPTPAGGGSGAGRAFSVQGYGLMRWSNLFTARQLTVLGTLVEHMRGSASNMINMKYPHDWVEAISAYLACVIDKVADFNSSLVAWQSGGNKGSNTFQRWALPIKWDFCENNILDSDSGGWGAVLKWVTAPLIGSLKIAVKNAISSHTMMGSATALKQKADVILTDPPYYDAIPYSDCMDFFYVWLRRALHGISVELDTAFKLPLSPKWDHVANDGELIDDESRHGGNASQSRAIYEDGMYRSFRSCHDSLESDGRLVIVFAHKDHLAWETLVSAIIRAGFVVDGSWPIQTEMANRTRGLSSSALASSVWLVCKKRCSTVRPGWDNNVLVEMRANIATRLREYWDAGIRGPDFVWAATGPALEAYSKYPVVKKANDPGKTMEVGEFLSHVRRMVVDYVVGQMLAGDRNAADLAVADRMDGTTAYYLLHRHDFGLEEAPSGACILYATACGLSDRELESTWDILFHTGSDAISQDSEEDEEENSDDETHIDDDNSTSGNKVKLKTWTQRKNKSMGYEAPGGQPVPLIDRVHRLMHLWRAGDLMKVDDYLDEHGLRRHELFKRLLQSLIELSPAGSEERTLLESLSNHIQAKGATPAQATMALDDEK